MSYPEDEGEEDEEVGQVDCVSPGGQLGLMRRFVESPLVDGAGEVFQLHLQLFWVFLGKIGSKMKMGT